jgi:hypothetical protein
MTRTKLDLDESVISALRERARREHKSMGRLASEPLARQLVLERPTTDTEWLHWISADLGVPLVDLEDKEAVAQILDRR